VGAGTADDVDVDSNDANSDDTSAANSKGSSTPDNPTVAENAGKSKYGRMNECTTYYNPSTGLTVGSETAAVTNYYQCLEENNSECEFANVGAGFGFGGGYENIMELKPIIHAKAINEPDG
jgi:hypothetical protein